MSNEQEEMKPQDKRTHVSQCEKEKEIAEILPATAKLYVNNFIGSSLAS